jgi:protein gp37
VSDGTHIEWTEATWNPITGCSVTSPGCTNSYAMKLAGTRLAHHPSRAGLTRDTKAGPVWTGEVRFNEQWLDQPLRWKRPRMIFVCAHGDLFHENVPDAWIDRVFAVMALCPQHTFQVLTKRSARMREYLSHHDRLGHVFVASQSLPDQHKNAARRDQWPYRRQDWRWPLPNVWLGVSVEDQARADERIPDLLATPAAVRWLSCEPMLSFLELGTIEQRGQEHFRVDMLDVLKGEGWIFDEDCELERVVQIPKLDWIVCGGESGSGARPMHPAWARSLRDQCAAADVPFFFKQWGEYVPATCMDNGDGLGTVCYVEDGSEKNPDFKGARPVTVINGQDMWRVGKRWAGRLLDGIEHNGMPAHG